MPNHPIKDPVTWLYPAIESYKTDRLQVSPIHELYYEESGNPDGKPAIFLHGGPGGGSDPKQRRFFHPDKYRIVNFDQRGCGKSTPYASLDANTTWDLVADIERLREHLSIDRWQVFGGSWGSTLALAYAETHPDRVTELILRGIFLLRKQEIDWFYQRGASVLYPDAWEPYLAHIPAPERSDLLSAYYRRVRPRLRSHRGPLLLSQGILRNRRPVAARRRAHPPDPRRDRARPLRRSLPHGKRVGAAPGLAGGGPHHHAGLRSQRFRPAQ